MQLVIWTLSVAAYLFVSGTFEKYIGKMRILEDDLKNEYGPKNEPKTNPEIKSTKKMMTSRPKMKTTQIMETPPKKKISLELKMTPKN